MSTIAILGANAQVGTEVCLHLSRMDGVRVVPVCRAEPATALLSRCGLSCRVGSLDSPAEARELLAGCDTVVEFSLPAGTASEVRQATRRLVTRAIESAPAGARYVFMSSIMAFGMAQASAARAPRRISRTVYGETKRHAEALVARAGRAAGREVFALRLGEVHGTLQAVSRAMLGRVRPEIAFVPGGPSYAVFTHTIAEAVAHIACGLEQPGRYTLVAEPALSWREVYEFYCRRAGLEPAVCELRSGPGGRIAVPGLGGALDALRVRRETIAAYLLWRVPELERRLRGAHARSRAAAEIAALARARQWQPFTLTFVGRMPGRRLRSLSDGRTGLAEAFDRIREIVDGARPSQLETQ